MKRTPEEQADYRKQYNKEHSQKYRAEHPERYATYMMKTTMRKMLSLGMDLRATVEELMKEVGA